MGVIEVKDDELGSQVFPHTPVAEDQYLAGTCYERAPMAQEWELDTAGLPYLGHIKSLSTSWKTLRHLADWMEVGTAPKRWAYFRGNPQERKERADRTNVRMIIYSSTHKPKETSLTTSSALKEALEDGPSECEEPTSRLFLVEDLSRQVIELLGSRFDVDPLFFREQIAEYTWFNTRDPWAMPPSLMAGMKHRNWFRMRHVRFRYYRSQQSYENCKREANGFNVFRRPDTDDNHWHYLDAPGSIIGMTRTRTSIWIGKDPRNELENVGIVLIDPTVSEGSQLWYGPTNWLLPPGLKEANPTQSPKPNSLFGHIVQATLTYPWFNNSPQTVPDGQVFVSPTLYAVCAEWLVLCEYIKARLAQIDWELEKPVLFRAKGDIIESSLKRLHVWRRVIPALREMVNETIEQALPIAKRVTGGAEGPGSTLDDIIPDFQRVHYALNELQARVDRLTAVVTSEMTTEDARRGLEENHNLARLTWLATTFIPLTWVAGLFSMSGDISELRKTFGWYFLTAVPLTLLTLLVAELVGRGWWQKRKAGKS